MNDFSGADRRAMLKAMMAAGGTAAGFFPSILRALEIPAARRTGTLNDVRHVVILTQENRAFDHYFGAMNGVRGFADRFLPPVPDRGARTGGTPFLQTDERPGSSTLLAPFHLDTRRDFRLIRHQGTPHLLPDAQDAWDEGRLSAWPQAKHNHAMGYFTRADIPFQYALAEAFTLCDAYHCALHAGTNPNRLFIWTGTNDPEGTGNGPAIDNGYDDFSDPLGHGGYTWTTYPERLQRAGVSFQVYEDMADNFTDNPLPGFQAYRRARTATDGPQADLARRTITTRHLDKLRDDVVAGTLPQVSWIVAPARYSEHPAASSPLQGADYTAQVLDALTANPEVWAGTVLFVNFDENDGLFDHVAPPAPPSRDPADPARLLGASTVPVDREYHIHAQDDRDRPYLNRPYGLGPRVPMIAVSPWSRGGYVASEVFDHTSVIRFLEKRFGVAEPNISAWRRAVCGDLTSCFDFSHTDESAFVQALPPMRALAERAAKLPHTLPETPDSPVAPVQEGGLRRRRATPYRLEVARTTDADGAPGLHLANKGGEGRAAVFHLYDVREPGAVPRRYTVGAGHSLTAPFPVAADGRYDLFLLGPNGFHRRYTGTGAAFVARLEDAAGVARLHLANRSAAPVRLTIRDRAYGATDRVVDLPAGAETRLPVDIARTHGWYDLSVEGAAETTRLAGHIENGAASFSDPVAHGPAALRFV